MKLFNPYSRNCIEVWRAEMESTVNELILDCTVVLSAEDAYKKVTTGSRSYLEKQKRTLKCKICIIENVQTRSISKRQKQPANK